MVKSYSLSKPFFILSIICFILVFITIDKSMSHGVLKHGMIALSISEYMDNCNPNDKLYFLDPSDPEKRLEFCQYDKYIALRILIKKDGVFKEITTYPKRALKTIKDVFEYAKKKNLIQIKSLE